MAPIPIPSGGISLSEFPTDTAFRKSKAPQAIKVVSRGNESMEQIMSRMRNGLADITVSLGKKPVLFVDNKAFPIQTLYQPQALLFKKSKETTHLQLSARVNLKDALARVKMNTSVDLDLNDPSILALQQSFADAKEKKDASKSIFVKDSSKLPPAKSGRSALLKSHRRGLFGNSGGGSGNSTTRSLPTSPSLGGVTPQPGQRDAKSLKQDAIKRALIHLLAVRAVSEKYMLSNLKCDVTDLKPLLEKYGRESNFDKTKFNLSERGYKELDVWDFPYGSEDDRKGAIERAIAAYDRQRISVVDPLWQKLLPKQERGKGKSLSKLGHLTSGPFSQVKAPKINVESAAASGDASDKDKPSEDERKGRLAPSDDQVRSRSQDPLDKKKVSEREEQSKRLFAKDPKKAADMARAKAKAAAEAADNKKKKQAAKNEEKKPAAKKGPSKNTAPPPSKIKSAEFVHDSDEDIELDDEPSQSPPGSKRKAEDDGPAKDPPKKKRKEEPLASKATPKSSQEKKPTETKPTVKKPTETKATEKKQVEKKPEKLVGEKRNGEKEAARKKEVPSTNSLRKADKDKPSKNPQPSNTDTRKSQPPTSETKKSQTTEKPAPLSTSTKTRIPESQRPPPMSRSLSHKRSGSSPVKPSPLGSSPPTNASDFENEHGAHKHISSSSSSSGSPLINQRRERLEATQKQATAAAARTSARTSMKPSASPNGSSDRPLKRRANDLDSNIHQHNGVVTTNGAPVPAPVPSTAPAAKRPRLPESPPATSPEADKTITNNTSSGDNLSPNPLDGKGEVVPTERQIDYARLFMKKAAQYNDALKELEGMVQPPVERVERLQKMHEKLVLHKRDLYRMARGEKVGP